MELVPETEQTWFSKTMAEIKSNELLIEFVATCLFLVVPFFSLGQNQDDLNYKKYVCTSFAFTCSLIVVLFPKSQLNPCVTIATMISKDVSIGQGLFNMIMQFSGAFCAAMISLIVYGRETVEKPGSSGALYMCNLMQAYDPLHPASETENAADILAAYKTDMILEVFFGEFMVTFVLVLTVYKLAFEMSSNFLLDKVCMAVIVGAVLYAGVSIMWDHDGGSLNPARSLGPVIAESIWLLYLGMGGVTPKEDKTLLYGPWASCAIISCATISASVAAGFFAKWTKNQREAEQGAFGSN